MGRPVLALWALFVVSLAVLGSCGPGHPTYIDRAKALGPDRADPRFRDLLPHLSKANPTDADALVRTWNEFLGSAPVPLRQDLAYTFVYYDFSHTLTEVWLEATFAPGRSEALHRVGSTGLFYRTYELPRADRAQYRFTDGKNPLIDPFNPDVVQGPDLWQPVVDALPAEATVQRIVGAVEGALGGRDLTLVLPPSFHRNLAWTYPLLVVVGLDGTEWTRPVAQLMQEGSMRPAVVVGLSPGPEPTTAELRATLEDRVLPWLRSRYRASPLATDLVLVGWGPMAKPVLEVAAARPEFWPKTWAPSGDQDLSEAAWNTLAPPQLRILLPVVKP